jgi:glycosyltransferase involved in cell wall biosynthesis
MLRAAVQGVLAQDYPGVVEIVVVHDQSESDHSVAHSGARPVTVVTNDRVAGLSGARNTGICSLATDLVAFCDDDDVWLPDKLSQQVGRLLAEPSAELCTSAITVVYEGRKTSRLAGQTTVTHEDLVRSRMSMLHSSTFLFRRIALMEGIGLLDESIPGSQNEDWELLLRASRRHPVAHVDLPLVVVRWGRSSFFSRQWRSRVDSLLWLMKRYPEIEQHPIGGPRVEGQIAFGLACMGHRREAAAMAVRVTRRRWREWRAIVALLVASGLLRGETVLRALHYLGRGV